MNLPNEIYYIIIKYCNIHDLLNIELINHNFYNLIDWNKIGKRMNILHYVNIKKSIFLKLKLMDKFKCRLIIDLVNEIGSEKLNDVIDNKINIPFSINNNDDKISIKYSISINNKNFFYNI